MFTLLRILLISAALLAQVPNPTQQAPQPDSSQKDIPIFRVTVVSRTVKAINYHRRSGATQIGFSGTTLMPAAKGEARVESRTGSTKIETAVERLQPANAFGPEFLTYVLWAVTPEGRADNLGELALDGDKARLLSTTELQVFGLIVTAEPYFAVTQPSDVVVMENTVRKDTTGTIEEVDAKYQLLQRGSYTARYPNYKPVRINPNAPLQLAEAENAVQIAKLAGAETYAGDTIKKALVELQNAQGFIRRGSTKKRSETSAREATQMAEDARIITIKKQQEEALARERAEAAAREAKAKAETEAEAKRRADAEAATQAEAKRRAEAEVATQAEAKLRAEADAAKQEEAKRRADAEAATQAEAKRRVDAEAASLRAEAASQKAEADRQRAETERLAAEQAKKEALEAARIAAQAKEEADAARAAALEQQKAAQAETEKARLAADEANRGRAQAETEKAELRQRLLQQFNLILETRDTARGLIVNMSDVLFDTGKYTLRAGAREKLAKVSGIILGHPGLKLEVEGHTDSIGGDDLNQRLSEERAEEVFKYLVSQGIPQKAVAARGFGKTQPVASNNTAAGRQRNRRVEMVVSGEVIGVQIGAQMVPASIVKQQ